jgi:hypothetical protein
MPPLRHAYSKEECDKIEKDMKEWIIDKFPKVGSKSIENQLLTSSVALYEVKGICYAKDKMGEPFEHMAIQVGTEHYYHLVFEFDAEHRYPIGVKFKRDLVENITREIIDTSLGETSYTSDEIMTIGRYLVSKFGSYSSVFWNCQHFAKLLASIITGKDINDVFFNTIDNYIAGFLFRVPMGGIASHNTILSITKTKSLKMLKDIPDEYKEILNFEITRCQPRQEKACTEQKSRCRVM